MFCWVHVTNISAAVDVITAASLWVTNLYISRHAFLIIFSI